MEAFVFMEDADVHKVLATRESQYLRRRLEFREGPPNTFKQGSISPMMQTSWDVMFDRCSELPRNERSAARTQELIAGCGRYIMLFLPPAREVAACRVGVVICRYYLSVVSAAHKYNVPAG